MNRRQALPALTFVLIFMAFAVGQWLFFYRTIQILDRRSAQLILAPLVRVLEHAHRLNDDLTVQEVIQGLGQAPGVVFAYVLDKDNRFLAHSQPSQLGKSCDLMAQPSFHLTFWAHSLHLTAERWGTLVIGLSKKATEQKTTQQAGLLIGEQACFLLCGSWLWKRWKQLHEQDQKAAEAAEFRRQELNQEMSRLKKNFEQMNADWAERLQQTLKRISQPLLVLNQTQQLIACNPAACELLGVAYQGDWRGRSWLDFPTLAAQGGALQRSLEQSGQKIQTSTPQETVLQFLSESTEGSISTWITWV